MDSGGREGRRECLRWVRREDLGWGWGWLGEGDDEEGDMVVMGLKGGVGGAGLGCRGDEDRLKGEVEG